MKLLLILLFSLGLIPTISAIDFIPHDIIYEEQIYLSERNPLVNFYVVPNAANMPCTGGGPGIVVGCAGYSMGGNTIPDIYVVPGRFIDEVGMTHLAHEILHVECRCDWHLTEDSVNFVNKYADGQPYRFIMANKELFQVYEIIHLGNYTSISSSSSPGI